jgi:molybdopterin synthase sulfur carrier subunit
MRVLIASPLYSYTGGRGEVEGTGATVAEVLADLDRRFPGIRFRIVDEQDQVRQHMRIYIGTEPAATLDQRIPADQEIHILQALSGGGAYLTRMFEIYEGNHSNRIAERVEAKVLPFFWKNPTPERNTH